jgi:hypothetical protein
MLQDSSVLGLDFARSSEGANILSFRLLGPYWDRWMLLRFVDVLHFDSERPNLFNVSALHWPELFTTKVGCEPIPAYIDALPEDAIGCHMYTLSLRTRYTVIAQNIEFISRVIPQQKTMRSGLPMTVSGSSGSPHRRSANVPFRQGRNPRDFSEFFHIFPLYPLTTLSFPACAGSTRGWERDGEMSGIDTPRDGMEDSRGGLRGCLHRASDGVGIDPGGADFVY